MQVGLYISFILDIHPLQHFIASNNRGAGSSTCFAEPAYASGNTHAIELCSAGSGVVHDCCYVNDAPSCERPGTIYIGENGNPDTDWICAHHFDKWHADRARFIAEGVPCEMEEL